ncbi:MAG: rhodanese-like domain-containing protein [Pyrinomonadaceae bacterium]
MGSPAMEEITPKELKERLDRGDSIQIIDVREQREYDAARIEGAKLIPLGEITARAGELNSAQTTVVHCKSGGRSAQAIEALRRAGYQGQLLNLKGGITAWSTDVDPAVPKY